ncbi:5'-methylthioadenosine/adenosylhomocysteine nucleosidase [Mycolicibacterium neoaurum]|uniref:5'-methylthioadenosine/adenosylhomocysteine nucleosidase n=1 Tax=Mycolicibacterium neoaurum TaxID=1795 RepID=UPI002673D272|nr:5'-methylthioadenosine/adenosylhomocysteine nucleosidase [Mycolicibacterium neoaurum]MDO3401588.1 5'-methylthioadenosine/adenosylhomocysteine nucleosidase [Mycolicibacterium neoaurum]
MTVGLICAVPEELEHLRAMLTNDAWTDIGGAEFGCGHLDGVSVVLAGAGMGKVNAAVVTTLLVHHFGCSSVMFSGVAGGLDPALAIGDIVIADRVIQIDAGMIESGRLAVYQAGHVEFINPTDSLGYQVNSDLLARVRAALSDLDAPGSPRLAYGLVLTGDQYLHCEDTRARLHDRYGALAFEMEGGAVAQVCTRFSVPWLVIRALSDLAGSDAIRDFAAFAEQVAASSAAVVRRVLASLDGPVDTG